jgi:hypothetical protein
VAVPKKFKFKKIKCTALKFKKNYFISIKIFKENNYIIDYIEKYYIG